jgi:hypothetical protein
MEECDCRCHGRPPQEPFICGQCGAVTPEGSQPELHCWPLPGRPIDFFPYRPAAQHTPDAD